MGCRWGPVHLSNWKWSPQFSLQVLFGIILRSSYGLGPKQQQKGASAVPALAPPSGSAGDSNVLRMSTGAPRFPYLPVNTPAMLRQAATPHMGTGVCQGELSAAHFVPFRPSMLGKAWSEMRTPPTACIMRHCLL